MSALYAARLSFLDSTSAYRTVATITIGYKPNHSKNDVYESPEEDNDSHSDSCKSSSRLAEIQLPHPVRYTIAVARGSASPEYPNQEQNLNVNDEPCKVTRTSHVNVPNFHLLVVRVTEAQGRI